MCFVSLFLSSLYLPPNATFHVFLLTISSYIAFTYCMFIGAGVVHDLCFIFSGSAFTLIGNSVFLSVRHRLAFGRKSLRDVIPFFLHIFWFYKQYMLQYTGPSGSQWCSLYCVCLVQWFRLSLLILTWSTIKQHALDTQSGLSAEEITLTMLGRRLTPNSFLPGIPPLKWESDLFMNEDIPNQ